jgi:cystathionine beta-lyase/cystathionine gamma-synthase
MLVRWLVFIHVLSALTFFLAHGAAAVTTHLSVAGSQLDIDPSLVRLSVGIENKHDLIEDLRQELDSA